jgi:hypothetical protein
MTVFVTDLDVFADARGDRQRAVEESLLQSCLYALRRYGQRGWLDALVARAEQVIRDEIQSQTDRSPSAEGRAEIASWRVFTRRALAQTSEPDPSTILSQAQTVAAMLSTSVLNTAAVAIGREQDEPMLKTWITVKDERVRASHAAVHGQSVPLGEKFTVGGVPMDRPGDLSAPPEETLNCRCLVGLTAESDALAASGEERTSALVVFLPASDDPVNEASSEDQAHVTTVWFGEADLPWPLINEAVAAAAAAMKPFTVAVKSRGLLGDKDADVLFLDADDLAEQRQALLDVPVIKDGMDSVEQYPQWTPHLTLGYPDSPATLAEEPEAITVDRLALWVGKERTTYPLGADMADDDFEPTPTDDLIDVVEAVPFWGVLAPEGTPSGDRRQFGAGSLRSRPLPLPLSYQRVNMDGHDGSVRVGTIERAWRKGSLVLGAGHLLTSIPEVDEVISVMAESGGRMGVSVDADDVEVEMTGPDGSAIDDPELAVEIMTSVPTARIAGATLCHIPAFHEAFIALGDVPDEYAPAEGEDLAIESRAQRSVAAAVKTEDGPGWLTHPADTDRLRDYWTHGKGAAKIGWGTPGDFNRCRANLAKYVKPMYLSGYCFTGDTEFLTRDGVTTFAEAVGTTVQVLTMKEPLGRGASPVTKSGYWVEAPVESFGEQPVLSVTLRRGKGRKVIRATPEHEWFASEDAKSAKRKVASKVTTSDLRPGMALASLMPMPVAKRRSQPSAVGIAHGVVYGDGHAQSASGASVDLWGEKDQQLLPFFAMQSQAPTKIEKSGLLGVRVKGLPNSWKKEPSTEEGFSYLLGWLAGYIAADGNVSPSGAVTLSSTSEKSLRFASVVANRLGISTHPIRGRSRVGINGKESMLYKLTFVGETFPESALLIREHRKNFASAPKGFSATRWVVESVEDHGEAEEVFCAVVPETETFALSDYIWVHNCANRHYDALGFWPGDHARKHSLGVAASGEPDGPFITLVADATERPNGDWFTDPLLTGPSPIVVTEDGRIFGHLATWGTCHIGISDVCITPPSSPTDYSFFRTGTVLTTTGDVPVGQITMGTGHANLQLNASRTVAHYDNTGTVVADVAAGEDEYGIWISGAVRASATPEQIAALRGSALSGDWRTIRGHLELVAALAVNVPGFPIPRIGLAASGGKQSALVAAGIAIPGLSETPIDLNTIVDGVLSAIGRREQMAAMMRESGRDPKSKMAALAAARKD